MIRWGEVNDIVNMSSIGERLRKRKANEVDVFVYTGQEPVPKDVISVRFHPSIVEVDDNDGPNLSNDLVFSQCGQLKEVVFNEGLEKIGVLSFWGCRSLESITLPSTLIELKDYAFQNCRNLREVVLNEGLRKIGVGVFHQCESLESINVPPTVTIIENRAFAECTRLREVALNEIQSSIDDYAFDTCLSLERFKFPSLSIRLDNIIQAGQRDIESKLDDIPAVEWRGGELFIPSVQRETERNWGMVVARAELDKEKLNRVKGLISYHEMKEATTMFELALWKARIDQSVDANVNRNAHRIEVPGPVKEVIMQYLD